MMDRLPKETSWPMPANGWSSAAHWLCHYHYISSCYMQPPTKTSANQANHAATSSQRRTVCIATNRRAATSNSQQQEWSSPENSDDDDNNNIEDEQSDEFSSSGSDEQTCSSNDEQSSDGGMDEEDQAFLCRNNSVSSNSHRHHTQTHCCPSPHSWSRTYSYSYRRRKQSPHHRSGHTSHWPNRNRSLHQSRWDLPSSHNRHRHYTPSPSSSYSSSSSLNSSPDSESTSPPCSSSWHCHRHHQDHKQYHRSSHTDFTWASGESPFVSCAPPPLHWIIRKIWKSKYVNFDYLLSSTDDIVAAHIPQIPPVARRPQKKIPKRVVADFPSWMEAWNVFLLIRTHMKPSWSNELIKYQVPMSFLFQAYPVTVCLKYDTLFHHAAARDPLLRWDEFKDDLLLWCSTRCSFCSPDLDRRSKFTQDGNYLVLQASNVQHTQHQETRSANATTLATALWVKLVNVPTYAGISTAGEPI